MKDQSYVAHLSKSCHSPNVTDSPDIFIDIPGGDNVILLTTARILSFWSKKLRLDWTLPFTSIRGVTIEDTGIRFAHKSGREQDRFIFIPDKNSQVNCSFSLPVSLLRAKGRSCSVLVFRKDLTSCAISQRKAQNGLSLGIL